MSGSESVVCGGGGQALVVDLHKRTSFRNGHESGGDQAL